MIMKRLFTLLVSVAIVLHCYAQGALNEIQLVEFVSGYSDPVGIYNAGDNRLFILEQNQSDIEIVDLNGNYQGKFLDLSSITLTGGERGLLGLAFHPEYATNGKFYVNYTNSTSNPITNGQTVIAEYTVSGDPNVADASSGVTLLSINQDFSNHNGGHIAFGADGYLYIGTGDGGSGGDPNNRAQDTNSHLGKMLRIAVPGDGSYSIPIDNPFVSDASVLDEIWSIGLRNPWKFSFDSQTGDLWIGDVGQNVKEEVNFEPAGTGGLNYGWRCREGFSSYNTSGCTGLTFTEPVADYSHSAGPCSITGGHVYRGSVYESMVGHYFLTDYCDGKFYSLSPDGNGGFDETLVLESSQFGFVAFGNDVTNELYAVNVNGTIYKITDPCDGLTASSSFDGVSLQCTAADSYQWLLDGAPISAASSSSYTPEDSGVYSCIVTDAGGCEFTTTEYISLVVGGVYLEGCTIQCSSNFNPLATIDDGSCTTDWSCGGCPGDFTGDGFINVSDLGGFLGVFGGECE
jgi:glucose/arabinose dehydrogenase